MEVLKPWPLKVLIDNVLSGKPLAVRDRFASYSRMNLLIAACVGGVLIYVLTGILTVANNYISISIGQRMVNDLRGQLFDHLQRLSLGFHRRREIGDLMVRIVYDTFAIQTITMNGIFQILASSILLVGMFIVMIKIDVTMTLIALGVIPMLVILIASVSGTIDRLATEARIKESALYTVAHRALASIHVVQAFTREAESYREFVRSSSESLGENLRLYTFQSVYAGGVSVVIAIGTALVMYFGALHVMSAQLTIGGLIVFTSYLASLYAPINQIFQTYGQVQGAKAGLRRCLELLAIDPEIQDRPGARAMPRVRGEIEFEDVVFSYEAANPVLKGISFTASAGESIAIVGPERRRQNHHGEPGDALLRAARGHHQNRRPRSARGHARVAAQKYRGGAAAAAGPRRHAAREYRAGKTRRERRRNPPRRRRWRASTRCSRSCRAASTSRSGRAATASPRARRSASPSRARCSRTRRS